MTQMKNSGLINRFRIGSDPEFALGEDNQLDILYASQLGLETAAPFGADMQGRLLELRPKPYRSVLRGLASLQTSMQWLAMHPHVMSRIWNCKASIGAEGIGGHIHFGRKAATRKAEVEALDRLYAALIAAGTFDHVASLYRYNGTGYGKLGDARIQKYGFEYRSLPCWLCSPFMAMVVLTLAKLAVYEAELFYPEAPKLFAEDTEAIKVQAVLEQMLAKYADRDTDAALALAAIRVRGTFPTWVSGDFRPAWGIGFPLGKVYSSVSWFPRTITPTKEKVREIERALLTGHILRPTLPEPNWTPTRMPRGWKSVLPGSSLRVVELGELLWGLVQPRSCSSGHTMEFVTANQNGPIGISGPNPDALKALWESKTISKTVRASFGKFKRIRLTFSRTYRTPEYTAMFRKFFLSGSFPVWEVSEALSPELYKAWQKTAPTDIYKPAALLKGVSTLTEQHAEQSKILEEFGIEIPSGDAAPEATEEEVLL